MKKIVFAIAFMLYVTQCYSAVPDSVQESLGIFTNCVIAVIISLTALVWRNMFVQWLSILSFAILNIHLIYYDMHHPFVKNRMYMVDLYRYALTSYFNLSTLILIILYTSLVLSIRRIRHQ